MTGSRAISCLLLSAVWFTALAQSAVREPPVKKSRQGICHERGSISYVQTIYFDSFETLDACLKSGGRIPNSSAVAVPEDRSIHWWQRFSQSDFDKAAALAVIGAAGVCVLFVLFRDPYRKWKMRRKYRKFAEVEKRKWEGHRRQ